eukprot:354001-Rhodomonas_salina.1
MSGTGITCGSDGIAYGNYVFLMRICVPGTEIAPAAYDWKTKKSLIGYQPRIALRICYAMCGTDIGHHPTRFKLKPIQGLSQVGFGSYLPICTDLAHGGVLTAYALATRWPMPGTDVAYADTRAQTPRHLP